MEAAALVALVVLAVPTPSVATDAQGDSLAAVLREVTGKFFVFFLGGQCYVHWFLFNLIRLYVR